MGVPIFLFDSTVKAFHDARPAIGDDPYPEPQDERQEIVHQLWQLRVAVAGWWTMETDYLRDLLQKYLEVQSAEAVALEKKAVLKAKRKRDGPRPAQITERLKDVWTYNQARKEGRRRQYQASGVTALEGD
jgi:hypothetical protein